MLWLTVTWSSCSSQMLPRCEVLNILTCHILSVHCALLTDPHLAPNTIPIYQTVWVSKLSLDGSGMYNYVIPGPDRHAMQSC